MRIDLRADLNREDDDGLGWALLSGVVHPDAVRPGAILCAGTEGFWSWVRITAVDEDGQIHSESPVPRQEPRGSWQRPADTPKISEEPGDWRRPTQCGPSWKTGMVRLSGVHHVGHQRHRRGRGRGLLHRGARPPLCAPTAPTSVWSVPGWTPGASRSTSSRPRSHATSASTSPFRSTTSTRWWPSCGPRASR